MLERDEAFDVEAARRRIRTAEFIVGDKYADNGGYLTGECKATEENFLTDALSRVSLRQRSILPR